jgi:hypothetical protein
LIAPVFSSLSACREIAEFTNLQDTEDVTDWVIRKQMPSGYFRNSEGLGLRDLIGSLPWNSFALEFLALASEDVPESIEVPSAKHTVDPFSISEDRNELLMSLGTEKILCIHKRTGEISRGVLPPHLINGKIDDLHAHILVKNKNRVRIKGVTDQVGLVDRRGNYFIPSLEEVGMMRIWSPINEKIFPRWKKIDGNISVEKSGYLWRRVGEVYFDIRRSLFDTPLFVPICRLREYRLRLKEFRQ